MTWTKSHDAARASGGNLASATSRERNAWLTQTFAKEAAGGLFLGGQCWMPGGVWEWDAGDKWSFQAWPGEAPIYGALILQQDGTWKAGTFEEERLFLIELPQ